MTIKILIVDDHPLMREAFQTAFATEDDLEVIGEASGGIEALEMVGRFAPDAILMDLLMPGMGGLEAITEILALQPNAKILVVTSLEDEDMIAAAIRAGALGYFPKSAPRELLLEAARKVANGEPYIPAEIAAKLVMGIHKMKKDRRATDEPLTTRQEEILDLMGKGLSDVEIAKKLTLSEATVRAHIRNTMQRLGAQTRVQALAHLRRMKKG